MAKTIGVILSERISAGLVVDHRLEGAVRHFPEDNHDDGDALVEMHTDALAEAISKQVILTANGEKEIAAVGLSLPGLVKNGVVEESPNLPQLKGVRIQEMLANHLRVQGLDVPVTAMNDADGMAAGLASAHGKLDHMIRVWTLGVGIGYGRYPFAPGVWEGGHSVVTLDEKEQFCGCGAFWIWSPKKSSRQPRRAIPAVWTSSGYGIGRWLRPLPPQSTWPVRERSSSQASMCDSSICRCSRTTCNRW